MKMLPDTKLDLPSNNYHLCTATTWHRSGNAREKRELIIAGNQSSAFFFWTCNRSKNSLKTWLG